MSINDVCLIIIMLGGTRNDDILKYLITFRTKRLTCLNWRPGPYGCCWGETVLKCLLEFRIPNSMWYRLKWRHLKYDLNLMQWTPRIGFWVKGENRDQRGGLFTNIMGMEKRKWRRYCRVLGGHSYLQESEDKLKRDKEKNMTLGVSLEFRVSDLKHTGNS